MRTDAYKFTFLSNDLSGMFTLFMQFPITAIREIKILKKLHHENVIKLKEIVTSPGTLVFLDLRTSIFYRWLTTILNYFAHTFCILLLFVRS